MQGLLAIGQKSDLGAASKTYWIRISAKLRLLKSTRESVLVIKTIKSAVSHGLWFWAKRSSLWTAKTMSLRPVRILIFPKRRNIDWRIPSKKL